jgi:hypothetical protein
MKKRFAVVMSVMFTLTMGMTALAAGSDSATATQEVSSVVNADGTTTKTVESALGTTVTVSASTTKTTDVVDGVSVPTSATIATGSNAVLAFTDASGKKIENVSITVKAASTSVISTVTSSISVGGQEVAVKAADIAAAIDLDVSGFSSGSATVPLSVDNVKKGESVYAIHIKNGAAEIIPAQVVDNGVVVITTSSFSPVIIVKGTAPAAATASTTAATVTADSSAEAEKSPKTADAMPMAMAMIMAVIFLAGAAACAGKSVLSK